MNIKATAISAGILVALSSVASAQPTTTTTTLASAPAAPTIYASGPMSPSLVVKLSEAEKAAFSLYEGVMQIAEAQIHATSCASGTYDINVYADGVSSNHAEVYAAGSTTKEFGLSASLGTSVQNRGQEVTVSLAVPSVGSSSFNGSSITTYTSNLYFNNTDNMMVANNASISIAGVNGMPDSYTGNVIKDFYMGNTSDDTQPDYYNVIDWGLQSVSKLGYPVDKWWQRSKSHRSDGTLARTVFVKDRLVGVTDCRIIIDTNGTNDGYSLFWQGSSNPGNTGTLTIAPVTPSTLVEPDSTGAEAWDQAPFTNVD